MSARDLEAARQAFTDDESGLRYGIGLKPDQFGKAAQLYEQAFGAKFEPAIRSRAERLHLLESSFVGAFAFTASAGKELVGLAGIHTLEGCLTGGITAGKLLGQLGVLRGLRAIAVLSLYDRTPRPGVLVMDGIAVDEAHRGRGIGTGLLQAIVTHARENGFGVVRLDVIETNPGAQRLYERRGFVPVRTSRFPWLRGLLGFGASTTMELRVGEASV